jgi:hypothetical protein
MAQQHQGATNASAGRQALPCRAYIMNSVHPSCKRAPCVESTKAQSKAARPHALTAWVWYGMRSSGGPRNLWSAMMPLASRAVPVSDSSWHGMGFEAEAEAERAFIMEYYDLLYVHPGRHSPLCLPSASETTVSATRWPLVLPVRRF